MYCEFMANEKLAIHSGQNGHTLILLNFLNCFPLENTQYTYMPTYWKSIHLSDHVYE